MKKIILLFLFVSFYSFAQNSPSINARIEVKNYLEPYHICKDTPVTLVAQPLADSLHYRWLHNGQTVGEGQSFLPTRGGIYQLVIRNGYREFASPEVQISDCHPNVPEEAKKPQSVGNNVLPSYPKITSTNPVICGSNTSSVLTASPTAAGFTYQWYYSNSEYGSYTAVSGATTSTHTTTTLGYYKVLIGDGSPPVLSNAFRVSDKPIVILSDVNDNQYGSIPLSGGVAQLKVTVYGQGPVYYTLSDGENFQYYESLPGTQTIFVSPAYNKAYSIGSVQNICGFGTNYGYPTVVVDNTTSLTPTTPSTLNVCAGQMVTLPYTTAGTWPNNPEISIDLYNTTTNSWVSNSYFSGFSTSPIKYNLPSDLVVGNTYKVYFYGNRPKLTSSSIQSSYTFTVTSSGCSPSAYIAGSKTACGSTYLTARPYDYSNPYTYQWYKDGVAIPNSNYSGFTITQSGNYYVNVSRGTYSSNSSTDVVTISGTKPIITTNNKSVCGGGATTLTASNYSGTLQWYRYVNGLNIPLNVSTSTYTATLPGYYFVKATSSTCEVNSNQIYISQSASVEILNSSMNNNPVSIASGQTTQLNISLNGLGPWTFEIFDGEKNNTYNSSISPYPLIVSPAYNTNYSVNLIDSKCGRIYSNGNSILVNVTPTASLSLSSPTISTVCQGSTIEIPYQTSGNWPSSPLISLELKNSSGSYYNYLTRIEGNPIKYAINSNTPTGTYNVIAYSYNPYINSVTSTYTINITAAGGAGCANHQAVITGDKSTCYTSNNLTAYPNSSSEYTYQWYKNGTIINGATYNFYSAYETGAYHVVITKTSSGFSSTSAVKNVTVESLNTYISTVSGSQFCTPTGGNLTYSINGNSTVTTYQWYKSLTDGGLSPVSGANSSTYTATTPGTYFAIVSKGNCNLRTSPRTTCPIMITMPSYTVCKGSNIYVNTTTNTLYSFYGTFRTFYLVNAVTGLDVATLGTWPFVISDDRFNINLPSNIGAGTYKVRCTTPEGESSGLSEGTITVLDIDASAGPSLTANPTSFSTSPTYVSLTAGPCLGSTYNWSINNTDLYNYSSTNTYNRSIYSTSTGYVSCLETNGCTTAATSVTSFYTCADPLEPNNSSTEAKSITSFPYTSQTLCLDGFENKDWFKFVLNGNVFYIMVTLAYRGISPGNYVLTLNLVGNTLYAETTPGSYFNMAMVLYDNNMKKINFANGNLGNGVSQIVQTLTIPCNNLMVLTSPDFDISAGTTSKPTAVNIEGLNKIANTATVDYRGEKSIVLKPGFETQISSGGVFKAQIKGCNDTTD